MRSRTLTLGFFLILPLVTTACQGTILYSRSTGSNGFDLYTSKPDGSAPVRLTNDPAFIEQWPSWSPDGSTIVFRGGDPRTPSTWELYRMAANGGAKTRITNNGAADSFPHVSPDNNLILFASNRNDRDKDCTDTPCNWDVFTRNMSTGAVTQLTTYAGLDAFLDLSPSGDKVAFTSDRAGITAIYTMNIDGSNVKRVTPPAQNAFGPNWSADGTKLVYADNGCDACGNSDLWSINVNGTGAFQITHTPSANETNPAWSPDGTSVVFGSQNASSQADVYTIRADGTGLAPVAASAGILEIEPDWKS